MSKISLEDVKKVAKLANLAISSQEEQVYLKQIAKIVGFIDNLSLVDISSIDPTFSIAENVNNFREDKNKEPLPPQEALKNTNSQEKGLFVVKGVFEDE